MDVEQVTPDLKLPPTLDWYRQAANWLVGLSTGALAVELSLLETIQKQPSGVKLLFTLTGMMYLAAIVTGVFFYYYMTAYANRLETKDKYLIFKNHAGLTPAQRHLYETKISEADGGMANAKTWYNMFYTASFWSFMAGALLLTASLGLLLVASPAADPPGRYLLLKTAPGDSALTLYPIKETKGDIWILEKRGAVYQWQRLPYDLDSLTQKKK